jgi:hypothetical protein
MVEADSAILLSLSLLPKFPVDKERKGANNFASCVSRGVATMWPFVCFDELCEEFALRRGQVFQMNAIFWRTSINKELENQKFSGHILAMILLRIKGG